MSKSWEIFVNLSTVLGSEGIGWFCYLLFALGLIEVTLIRTSLLAGRTVLAPFRGEVCSLIGDIETLLGLGGSTIEASSPSFK